MPQIQATGGSSLSGTLDIQSKSSLVTTGAIVGTTETTIVVPSGAKAFKLQVADSASGAVVLTIAHAATGTSSAITSFDIYAGSSYEEELLKGDAALTLYIKASKAATAVQLLYWT